MNKIFFILTLMSSAFRMNAQPTLDKVLPGKWKVCYDTKYDEHVACDKPFAHYVFTNNGQYTTAAIVCQNDVYIPRGTWTLEGNNLTIIPQNDSCNTGARQIFYSLIVVNNDLFYMKSVSSAENPNGDYYYYFRREK